jgi:hypothetical protein
MYSVSGTLASMACGLPYTIAAQIAYPERQCVALVGDGGFTMLMGEFATAVKYQLPIKIFIAKNNVLGQIKWEQMVFLGNPEYGVDLPPSTSRHTPRPAGARASPARTPPTVAASSTKPCPRRARSWWRPWSTPTNRHGLGRFRSSRRRCLRNRWHAASPTGRRSPGRRCPIKCVNWSNHRGVTRDQTCACVQVACRCRGIRERL